MKLRTSFLVGLPTIAICAALMVGLLVLKLRLPEIEAEQRQRAEAQIKVLVDSVDNLLSTYEASLKLASVGLESGANAQFELNSLKRAEPAFSLVYVADKLGEVKFIGKEKDRSHATTIVLPVKSLRALRESATRSGTGWSNQFLSIASGETVIGLGRPTGEGMLIAELLPSSLKDTVANVAAGIDLPMIIIDGNGAMVSANTATFGGRFDNFANVPALRNAMDGIAGGQFATPESSFHIVSSKSKKLGWTYVIGLPLGISNVDYRRTIFVVGLGVLGASFIALMFAPWLSTIFARPLVV